MPTTINHTIGSTGDYATIAAWVAALPANLVTADQVWVGQLQNQTFNEAVSIGTRTSDVTRYPQLTCVAGSSFHDNASVRSNALKYNTANGAAIQTSGGSGEAFRTDTPFTRLTGVQLKCTAYASTVRMNAASCLVDSCVITCGANNAAVARDNATSCKWVNTLVVYPFTAGDAVVVTGQLYNCTLIGGGGTSNGLNLPYNQAVVKNCAIFNFNTVTTGTTAAGSDYNGTDAASASTGSHNQVSLTFASQFVSTTTDFRALAQSSGTGLHNATPDSTNAAVDISVFARDATTPYMGAWEASAPAISFTLSPATIPDNHASNISLTASGTGTSWTNGSTVTVTNSLTGTTTVTKVSWTTSSTTAGTLVVTTGEGAGTYKVTIDGTDVTGTLTVGEAAVSISPTSGVVSNTYSVTLTGSNTLWATDHPAFTCTGLAGTSIGSIGWTNNTTATATITTGSTAGTATITDPSSGETCTFTVNAVSGSITVAHPVTLQGFQRDGSNQATLTISGTYTGGPGTLTMECDLAGSGYATFCTAAGGTFSGTRTFTVTPGTSNVQGTLTVRFVNATGINATVALVGIGDVLVIAGQSNAEGHLLAKNNYTHATLHSTVFDRVRSAWSEGNDNFYGLTDGSIWPLVATLHMADQGVPLFYIQTAYGGKPLTGPSDGSAYWFTKYRPDTGTGQGTGYALIPSTTTASGVNAVKGVVWYQGENDSDDSVVQGMYEPALCALGDNLHADLPGSPKLFVIQIGYGSGGGPIDPIRLGLSGGTALGTNCLGMTCLYDIPQVGGQGGGNAIHLLTASDATAASTRVWAMLKSELFGGTSGAGHGPRVVSCQYNAARTVITVTFDAVLKTGLTFATGIWAVTGNGSGATVNSVGYNGTDTRAVDVTLSAAAALPILVSFGLGGSTAGLVVPLGPTVTGINLPAEPFQNVQAAAEQGGSSPPPGGGLLQVAGMSGGSQRT